MAGKPPKLTVQYSPRFKAALDEIWLWNAKRYDADHANNYVAFLKKKVSGLATSYPAGRIVPTAPELRYIVIQRSTRGQGHVAIYKVVGANVNVITLFHTAQDWQGKLARGGW